MLTGYFDKNRELLLEFYMYIIMMVLWLFFKRDTPGNTYQWNMMSKFKRGGVSRNENGQIVSW